MPFWWGSRTSEAAEPQPPAAPTPAAVPVVQARPVPQEPPAPSTPREQAPAVPANFVALNGLSEAELNHLQHSVDLQSDVLHDEPAVKTCAKRVEELRAENSRLAKDILSQEQSYTAVATRVTGARERLAVKRAFVEALASKKEAIAAQRAPAKMRDLLAEEAHKADAEAEEFLLTAASAGGALDEAGLSAFRDKFVQMKMDKHWRLALKASLAGR
mmetsp:Transcript_35988/g.71645  ORF Transcript_35988/g.71645 Transcript_35988/m.71645 type:complete len:216 (+) Transcript_35988:3-650(+)